MRDKFWIWFAIKWFGFCRWFSKQAMIGYIERKMEPEALRWRDTYQKYDLYYGLALYRRCDAKTREVLNR